MKLKDLLNVLRSNAKIIDWNTMKLIGEFNIMYFTIINDDFKQVKNYDLLLEREIVFINNDDEIRIGVISSYS